MKQHTREARYVSSFDLYCHLCEDTITHEVFKKPGVFVVICKDCSDTKHVHY